MSYGHSRIADAYASLNDDSARTLDEMDETDLTPASNGYRHQWRQIDPEEQLRLQQDQGVYRGSQTSARLTRISRAANERQQQPNETNLEYQRRVNP